MRQVIAFLVSCITLTGCAIQCFDPQPKNECVSGDPVIKGCCSATTVFDLDPSFPLGDTITLNGTTYFNAIQIPGQHDSAFSLKLREFNPDGDSELLYTQCRCIQAEPWADLPIFVIAGNCNAPVE